MANNDNTVTEWSIMTNNDKAVADWIQKPSTKESFASFSFILFFSLSYPFGGALWCRDVRDDTTANCYTENLSVHSHQLLTLQGGNMVLHYTHYTISHVLYS